VRALGATPGYDRPCETLCEALYFPRRFFVGLRAAAAFFFGGGVIGSLCSLM
jgi:hypothetical protein